jgi:hypothetical protein
MENSSIKSIDFSYKTMKTTFLLVLIAGLISAQYLTTSSCSGYTSYNGSVVSGVYTIFPVLNFTVFNVTVTQASDPVLYKELCSSKNNSFYGFNASLQTCANQTTSNAVLNETGFYDQNLSVNVTLSNQSSFTYFPVNETSSNITSFNKQNPSFSNSLNKTVNASNSTNAFNFTYHGLAFNPKSDCYFPLNLTNLNFSVSVTSVSGNGSLFLNQTQNETITFSNSTGSWVANTSFSAKSFNYDYNGSLPANFSIVVERLYNPSEVTSLRIDAVPIFINFTDVKKQGLAINYYSNEGPGTLLNAANPFDLNLSNFSSYNERFGWNIELKADPSTSAFTDSYSVSVVNVTITPISGYVQKAIQYGKSFFNDVSNFIVTPAQAATNAENQVGSTKLADADKCANDIAQVSASAICSNTKTCCDYWRGVSSTPPECSDVCKATS